jgi:hypothetical protein
MQPAVYPLTGRLWTFPASVKSLCCINVIEQAFEKSLLKINILLLTQRLVRRFTSSLNRPPARSISQGPVLSASVSIAAQIGGSGTETWTVPETGSVWTGDSPGFENVRPPASPASASAAMNFEESATDFLPPAARDARPYYRTGCAHHRGAVVYLQDYSATEQAQSFTEN